MNSEVIVTATDGCVIVQSKKNSIFGYIRLEQVRMLINSDNWCTEQKLSALIRGTMIRLKKLGWVEGQVLPGRIKIIEQMEPFNKKAPERDLKIAGKTGMVCIKDGAPIYRGCFWSENPNDPDILIKHDNGDAISLALEQMKEEEKASL